MFAVVNHLHFSKPVDELKEILANEGLPLLSSNPSFGDFHFVKVAEDKTFVIILWQDAASAQAGAKNFGQHGLLKISNPILPDLKNEVLEK
jgi:heme-degrading monooxygenase HmoA